MSGTPTPRNVRSDRARGVNIVGAGLAGALLAVMLAKRGFAVTLYERRSDPRSTKAERGRSINLALAARGIRALEHAGLMHRVQPLMIPMRGRMVHELSRAPALLPYGQREHEVIYSIGRAALNRMLIEEAARHSNVRLRFDQACTSVDLERDVLAFTDGATGRPYEVPLTPTIATDGAGSAVRNSLAAAGRLAVREEPLDHDYKELTIPPVNGEYAIEPDALHVWPRGGFMLIALPNTDRSFTATLFLARTGERSFASLSSPGEVRRFFEREFPDAVPLIPELLSEFRDHPQGQLGTLHTAPWRANGQVLLLGDAAHAIVPFHGQGMNAAFEDCQVLDELIAGGTDWAKTFAEFESRRRPNAEAIARMALENYVEMRDRVLDEKFLRHKALALQLERRFPDRFIPRYSMVMFHPEIPYAEALKRGQVQEEILDVLDEPVRGTSHPDFAHVAASDRARDLIEARLPAIR